MTKRGPGAPRLADGEATKSLQVLLPESLLTELSEVADEENRSLSHLGREAIKQFLFLRQAQKR